MKKKSHEAIKIYLPRSVNAFDVIKTNTTPVYQMEYNGKKFSAKNPKLLLNKFMYYLMNELKKQRVFFSPKPKTMYVLTDSEGKSVYDPRFMFE
jgi:hypothetical protein